MKKQKPTTYAFSLQTILTSVVLLVVCAILLQVFAAAIQMSHNAQQITYGTQLCRTGAEAFIAAEDTEQLAELLQGTQRENQVYVQYSDGYQICITIQQQPLQTGTMEYAHIQALTNTGAVCMELDTQAYRANRSTGGGENVE